MTTIAAVEIKSLMLIPSAFAAEIEPAFAGVASILPNIAVLNAAERRRRRGGEAVVELIADEAGIASVYMVWGTRLGRDVADYILIDSATNNWIDLAALAADEDEAAEFVEAHPALTDLVAALAA
ncbi:MAG: hypothetical protein ACRCT8_12160 [Lacipirellulaceae bacterium]